MSETKEKHSKVPEHQILRCGKERCAVIVIDDFYPAPDSLVKQAGGPLEFSAQQSDFYPGRRKMCTGCYPEFLLNRLDAVLRDVYRLDQRYSLSISLCAYSMATLPERRLRPIQCLPHIDTHDALQFAVVHYLCDERYGGTSFYRHRSTGFESIDDARMQDYFKRLKQEVMDAEPETSRYIDGDTKLFERLSSVNLKFNRAVIYASNQLHSGDIRPALGLSADPRKGRLTLNTFLRYSA